MHYCYPCLGAFLLTLFSCQPAMLTSTPESVRSAAQKTLQESEPVVAWMQLARTLVKQQRLSPPVASRLYAYTAITLHETLNSNQPLAGRLNGLNSLPQATSEVDTLLVAHRATALVLADLLPNLTAPQRNLLDTFAQAQIETRKVALPEDIQARSLTQATAVARP